MGMWAPVDPNHTPKYHSFGEDVRDLGRFCWRVVKWPLVIITGLAALLLLAAAALNGAVPDWAWYWIAGAFMWKVFMDTIRQIVREELARSKDHSDAPPR
jgi:aminoglycoside phosphotransferase (APT) family kinase protein